MNRTYFSQKFTTNTLSTISLEKLLRLPRKEYKTITVKVETFNRFIKATQEAKKSDPEIDNSLFVDSLLDLRKKHK